MLATLQLKKREGMSNLPRELIVDILSRLPVKSLCRFKCVSKPWRTLISHPDFVKTHLHRAQFKRLILASADSLYSVDHETSYENDVVAVALDNFPLDQNDDQFYPIAIISSCNGLLCLNLQPDTFFVFNPATHESARIPDAPTPYEFDHNILAYGFGYAPSIDDYKLVKAVNAPLVAVFSLKTVAWKLVEGFHYEKPTTEVWEGPLPYGTHLNGALHWVFKLRGGYECVIAAFDLETETFREMPVPANSVSGFSTGFLKGCLCLMDLDFGLRRRDIWVMKEYGVEKSWTRILVVDPCYVVKPLCLWKESKILMTIDRNDNQNQNELVLCNPKDGTCKNFEVVGTPFSFYADTYVESLVSPKFSAIV
ncbi:F-box/kelch-repeat protein At3g06240 [Quercus suber]|uniref:F-box/kelch-repeat protein n=1 Tax=Quercus suber TaxID=58331 RepID=A0AAW0L9D0_QUESU|nr:F-box/kelch-repeat protein At3g06240-like [Quercus suber]POE78864.1 f-box/kelch-repeat protein [Quercus suber]